MQVLTDDYGYYCIYCDGPAPEYEPEMCCSGYECGCGGQPMNQCFCSEDCEIKHEADEALERRVRVEASALRRIRRKRIWKVFQADQSSALASDTLPESFTQWPLAIKAAMSDLNVVKYRMQTDNSGGIWLFGDCPDFADHTYHGYTDRQQDGFAGRHITFDLVDGGSVTLKGPFKGRPPKGMDARVMTRGVIGTSTSRHPDLEDYFGSLTTYHGVLHLDRDWELGDYNRIEDMAQSLADDRNERVYFRSESKGGAYSYWKEPQKPVTD